MADGPRLRFRIRPPIGAGTTVVEDRWVEVAAGVEAVRFGRCAGHEVTLPFSTVSGLHARLTAAKGGWYVEDLGSANGTWIAGRRLLAHKPEAIARGDEFRLADVVIAFHGEIRDAPTAAGGDTHGTETIARRLVADLFGALRPQETALLTVIAGPDAGRSLALEKAARVYLIGRDPACALALSDPDMSRVNAEIERRWDGIFLRDPGSKNGVEVEGRRIAAETRLGDGHVIALGGTRIRIDDPEDRYLRQMARDDQSEPGAVQAPMAASGTAPLDPGPAIVAAPAAGIRARRSSNANLVTLVAVAVLAGLLLCGGLLLFAG